MDAENNIEKRKNEHLQIVLEEDVSSAIESGFDRICLMHQALPEIDFEAMDLSTVFLGRKLEAPLLISSMTGGSDQTAELNRTLALAAEEAGIAIAVGSVRAGIEKPARSASFALRKYAPTTLVFSNLGAVQLNYGYSLDTCRKAVDMVGADGLYLHLNALQELLQPGGNTNWSGLLIKIERLARTIDVPVLIKEVGWGINARLFKDLENVGVAAIDVAGAGGTSWSQVEMYRLKDQKLRRIASDFRGWGLSTVDCLTEIFKTGKPKIPVIASGGLRNGIDLAKSLALGASMGGFGRALLPAAHHSPEALVTELEIIKHELKIALFACGVRRPAECSGSMIFKRDRF